eukprot:203332_1
MGRKQNRAAIWNSFKQTKKLIREKGHADHSSNTFMIDPEEQKQRKIARKLAEKLKPIQPSKKHLQKLQRLKEKKAKEKALKDALSNLQEHQLTNAQLALLVSSTSHKETKKERLRRLYLTKKAGIDIDESELYTITSTPQQILQLKNKSDKNTFDFGNVSQNTLNASIPGAMDKDYALNDGIKVISTRTMSRKRKKNAIVLMDKTDPIPEECSSDSDDSEPKDDTDYTMRNPIDEPPKKKRKRITFGGLKCKQSLELQSFLECASDDEVLTINTEGARKRKSTVTVHRRAHIIKSRMELPIIGEEHTIMESIRENDVVLICGETGSGKSTQVPQFLYEAGYGLHGKMIGVTEPRRVAAMSVSKRVGVELNQVDAVSYQIRYDSCVTRDTRIKFMTDGILLREIQYDLLLRKYSVIILDEAHERNLNSDVLIGLLSRIVRRRRALNCPLKLIIMSATLKVEDFGDNVHLFDPPPPVINIPSRQFPVTVHFNKVTPMREDEYENELFDKICKIHVLLPAGHILVFLTGRRQIEYMCNRLRERFNAPSAETLPVYAKKKKFEHYMKKEEEDEEAKMADIVNEEEDDERSLNWKYRSYAAVNVLPLYSLLSPEKQSLVFDKQRDRNTTRLIVIATNIAETSITIPGIRYVVDCGRVKQEKYSSQENMSKMVVEFISKSSASQRAGRSGRTGPGHCYRLYSSNFYDEWMVDHFEPEILRVPIESIILRMKAMNIESISCFPFPTPPPQDTIFSGLRILEILNALRRDDGGNTRTSLMMLRNTQCLKSDEDALRITDCGRSLIEYPISVRCAKMLLLGAQGACLPFVLAICCVLSVESLQFEPDEMDKMIRDQMMKMESFKNEKEKQRWHRKEKRKMVWTARHQFANPKSDILSFLNIFGAFKCYKSKNERQAFCAQHYVRFKKMQECNSLMAQLQKIVYKIHAGASLNMKMASQPPSAVQQILLRQIIASGLLDQIARKWPQHQIPNDDDWIASKRNYLWLSKAYECMSSPHKPVFIHPSSYIYSSESDFVVYYSLNKSSNSRTYMRYVTAIESHWLLNIAPHLCIVSPPLDTPKPFYDETDDAIKCYVEVRFGPFQWELPRQTIKYPAAADKDEKVFGWFARLLLEGEIFTDLKCIKPYLQYRPTIITDNQYSMVSNKAVIALV